jgi:AMP-polyphosphate phosphotransferase
MATKKIRLSSLPPLPERSKDENDRLVKQHQEKLVRIQQALLFTGERAVVVFEGMDAAGKGGTIRRLAWAMDPRSLKVWPIGAPNEIEARQHYLQRFWTRLPEKSQIAVFDRSWYGRVLVERVEELTPKKDWQRAYGEINAFERQLVDDGIRVVKIFLHISKDQQRKELIERMRDPLKRWKLSYDDFRNRARWPDYIEAIEDMFDRTSTAAAPWHVVPSDDKAAARAHALGILVRQLSRGLDLSLPPLDRKIARTALKMLGKNAVKSVR